MSIPSYEICMLPILEILSDDVEHSLRDLTTRIADKFNLTDDEREQLLSSGQQPVIANRVAWAKTYLKKAGLIEQPKRGIARISAEGKNVLKKKPRLIDNKFLKKYPSYHEFVKRNNDQKIPASGSGLAKTQPSDETQTPEELLEDSYRTLRKALADELIDQIKTCSPVFFEKLVVELLVAMGYGGSIEDAGKAIGKSGDGGIDGIIKEDKLGLDIIVIQAKRWDSKSVGRPEVQGFVGSMEPYRARKGVFITTSTFTETAIQYVKNIERKIVLIDGPMLTNLMMDHGIGITAYRNFVLNRLDSDYFEE